MAAGGGANTYNAPLDANATLKAEAKARFGEKLRAGVLHFIMGEADACNCQTPGYANGAYCYPLDGSLSCPPDGAGGAGCCDTWPDATNHNAMDSTCDGMVQGSNRLQRGLLYVKHLERVFGFAVPIFTVPGMGHNNSDLYASPYFLEAAYYAAAPAAGAATAAAAVGAALGGAAVGVGALLAVIAARKGGAGGTAAAPEDTPLLRRAPQ